MRKTHSSARRTSTLGFLLAALAVAGIPASGQAGQSTTQTAAPTAGLRILVIEGEDGVNIIQTKTAIAPVVEVRDRNDLPVAGVVVTFAINRSGSGAAIFAGGGQTLTVTTDAAGRASASGLTPTRNGTLQIAVTAVYAGQTATATITQRNFTSAAQATQAGAVAGSGRGFGGTGVSGGPGGAGGSGTSGSPVGAGGTSTGGSTTGGSTGSGGSGGSAAGAAKDGSSKAIKIVGVAAGAGAGLFVAAKAGGDDATGSNTPGTTPTTPTTPTSPTTTTYTGTFSGEFVAPLAFLLRDGTGPDCTYKFPLSGTLTVTLRTQAGVPITGSTLVGTGSQSNGARSCSSGTGPSIAPLAGPIALSGPVSGTSTTVGFNQTFAQADANGENVVIWTFTGTLSNGVMSGTLMQVISISTTSGGVGTGGGGGSVNLSVTLR